MPDSIGTPSQGLGGRAGDRHRGGLLVRGLMVAVIALAGVSADADQFVDQVNQGYASVSESKRSDLVILPLLINLEEPPVSLRTPLEAALLPAGGPGWDAAEDWASGEPQQALVKGLAEVTADADFRTAMQFAQPYGIEGVAGKYELISAGFFTNLGDPPTLAAAKHGYMPAMRRLELLAHVEATRRLAEGDAAGAVDHMINWAMFTRQFADRRFLEEKVWALEALQLALERIRDLAYQDFKSGQPQLTPAAVKEDLERIGAHGYLDIERLKLPVGDFIAVEQLLRRIINPPGEGGAPDPEEFALTMSRIAAAERPLRLFAEAAFWRNAAASHAGWHESMDMARDVPADWERRWLLRSGDPVLSSQTDYDRMVLRGTQFSVISYLLGGVQDLFPLRQELRVETMGTRLALALYGYHLQYNSFAPSVAAVRPHFLPMIERDPFSRTSDHFGYFIPVRDTPQGSRGEIRPWEVNVFPPQPYAPFLVPFTETQENVEARVWSDFILYSVGPDNRAGRVQFASQADPDIKGDYIIWPSMISMLRKRLVDSGQLE